MANTKAKTEENMNPVGTVEISENHTVREVLDAQFGVDKWTFEVIQTNFPPGYVAVNGRLVIHNADGIPVRTAPGVSLVPLKDDPTASFVTAVAVAQRVACKFLGFEVEIPEFELVNAQNNQNNSRPAAPQQINAPRNNAPRNNSNEEEDIACEDCGNPIVAYTANSGKFMSVSAQAEMSQNKYEANLCKSCNTNRWKAAGGGNGGGGNGGNRAFGGNRGGYNNARRFN